MELQGSVGNAAVARLIGERRSPPPATAVQRDEESAALLKTLATPRIAEGPAVEVQTQLVDELERVIQNKTLGNEWRHGEPSELNLGGILVDRLPNAGETYKPRQGNPERKEDVQALFGQLAGDGPEETGVSAIEYVGLDGQGARSSGAAFGKDVKKAGLDAMVLENTLKTMLDAEQFEYLRLAGLPNDEWKILVELHYIRSRPKDMAGFHKDTQGQTLFVNLNYHVPGRQVRGPEYVLNPPVSDEHDRKILGTGGKPRTLPQVFTDDLASTRGGLGEPTRIESSGTVQPLGYVAFVDEAIHHATPWFGGRYVTPTEFKEYLVRNDKAKLDEIARADAAYRARSWGSLLASFAGYVNKTVIPAPEIEKWRKWLVMSNAGDTESESSKRRRELKYTRSDFAGTMPGNGFDLMLEDVGSQEDAERGQGGAGGWYAASIPNSPGESLKPPIKPGGRPPLVRTASNPDLTRNWPEQLPAEVPRRFIRSWVRAVPANFAGTLRGG
jgi:hypothetical protein